MDAPLIAIVGSADANRDDYEPPLNNPEGAKQVAERLGYELAERGFRILVFSGSPSFIEGDFVRGFVSAPNAKQGSIQVRYSPGKDIEFQEAKSRPGLFDPIREKENEWEVSFYQSLYEVDGMILIGGGTSTLIAGLIAIKKQIPLLALAAFGGKALSIWELLSPDKSLADDSDINKMAEWNPQTSAQTWVEILSKQRKVLRERQKAKPQTLQDYAVFAGITFLVAFAIAVIGYSGIITSYDVLLILLLFCPLLAGASGAMARTAIDWKDQAASTKKGRSILSTAALGLMIGGVSALLFVLAQRSAIPEVQGQGAEVADMIMRVQTQNLIPFAFAIGFVGGLTLDDAFRKLTGLDVVDTSPIAGSKTSEANQPEAPSLRKPQE